MKGNIIKKFTGEYLSFNHKEEIIRKVMHFVKVNKIKGDYYEFGLYKGKSFIAAYKTAQELGLKINFIGYDSFKGLPKNIGDECQYFQEGDYKCSFRQFQKILLKNKVDLKKVKLNKGFFEDRLIKPLTFGKASIVYVDVDYYSSAKLVLEYIKNIVGVGTIIIFDDYYCYGLNFEGEDLAFSEWCNKYFIMAKQYNNFGWAGNSFIITEV